MTRGGTTLLISYAVHAHRTGGPPPFVVGVAQLVEHLVVVQVAAGSSPVTHPDPQGYEVSSHPWGFFASSSYPRRNASTAAAKATGVSCGG